MRLEVSEKLNERIKRELPPPPGKVNVLAMLAGISIHASPLLVGNQWILFDNSKNIVKCGGFEPHGKDT